jgi:hypothetical protein
MGMDLSEGDSKYEIHEGRFPTVEVDTWGAWASLIMWGICLIDLVKGYLGLFRKHVLTVWCPHNR